MSKRLWRIALTLVVVLSALNVWGALDKQDDLYRACARWNEYIQDQCERPSLDQIMRGDKSVQPTTFEIGRIWETAVKREFLLSAGVVIIWLILRRERA